jgi:hypothetical protein
MKLVTMATPIFAQFAEAVAKGTSNSNISQPAIQPMKPVYKYDLTATPYF